ncbi:protein CFAP20DC isoform X1 [Rissa tridactyla]|uniref:protein CFAP20DC isoform X1 n=2 Tax=Rissa tridactyla TaxID=75485 RepID=UPI0023BB01BB|nr:protein CFAP20DC isoform X1 [Rissa tridactyla]XP_054072616.1 protein CFAP20DC isoform X1 [Rissa tridactyla]XP_054072617.1 protein CFAP20DC isoform X1 [Rissa tridactyla]
MFKNHYQGGPFVEIFSAQGKNPGAKWKIFGNPSAIWKEYDKEVKGFVFVLEGSSQINKMQLPKETRRTLGLIQQFLTLQIFVPLGQDFSTELLVTDLGNIKRRLYLSTVHKELSVTPLHAKIPLFTIKRKIWCNMCIDLVAFTSEIFRGAVFQSLDGIIISANCKLRKIFTLKSKPQDTAEEDGMCVVPSMRCEPTDVIPRTCQLNTDVPQVTQLLNLTKIREQEIKCSRYPVTVQETGSFVNKGQGNIRSGKTQDASHIAFGSKILGPPPSSNRRVSARVSGEVTKTCSSKSNRSYRLQSSGKRTESVQDIERLELSFSPCNYSIDQGGKRNTCQTTKDLCQNDPAIQTQKTSESGRADFQLASPQRPSADKNSHRTLSRKKAAKSTWEITSDEWVFPDSFTESIQLDRSEQFVATEASACHKLTSPQNASVEHHSNERDDHQVNNKEIFTFSSTPRSAPHGKSSNMSPECCIFPLDLKQDSNRVHGKTQIEDNFQGTDSSEEDDNNEFVQGTDNPEISRSQQGTSDSAVFKEIPLNRMSWKNEYWKKKEHSKHNHEETVLSKPQSSTERKPDSVSSQRSLKPTLSLSPTGSKSEFFKVIPNESEKNERHEGVSDKLKRSISKKSLKKISRENPRLTTQTCEYDWKNYQSNRLSSSELQMLASMKRQQNEELRDTGVSHGLSASQIDNCNISISTSSDDTATWNSCFPPPVSQEHHYQKEMSPLSHSNPRDWLNAFSPPIIPGNQQLEEHTKPSANQSVPGEDDLNAEEDEEVLTLLYDPCLNCYFDPNSGKYYELA